jgi:DNA mismatch repair protein MutS2
LDESQDATNNRDQKWFESKLEKRYIVSSKKNQKQSTTTTAAATTTMDHDDDDDNTALSRNDLYHVGQKMIQQQQQQQQPVETDVTGSLKNGLNLFQRTLTTLDYPLILKTLQEECNTLPAKRIVDKSLLSFLPNNNDNNNNEPKRAQPKSIVTMGLTANDVSEIHERYRAVGEMKNILDGYAIVMDRNVKTNHNNDNNNSNRNGPNGPKRKRDVGPKKMSPPPLNHPNFDLQPMWEKIDAGGVLDGPDVFEVRTIMEACRDVFHWCRDLERATTVINKNDANNEKAATETIEPSFWQLPNYGKSIFVDEDLLELLQSAFDEEGKLSGSTFQGIGRLRSKVRSLKADILLSLDKLLSTPSMKSKISLESGGALYSEVRGRIVIPISEQYANSVGIVHDVSRSGKTVYMEPSEIVKPTNEMNQAIMELQQEESKVWRMLTAKIAESRSDIDQSVAVIAQLDLVLARIRLGDRIAGVIPEVKDEGVISLKNAKHPVLLLREIDNVVGSDIDIGAGENQGLILTGPNSGGKTVILKLLGLSALMARDGIPVPAHPDGARVDYFNPVLADIGDLQSVGDDLSTFSGHMVSWFIYLDVSWVAYSP